MSFRHFTTALDEEIRESPETDGEEAIMAWLAEATEEPCPRCGVPYLMRFERLNGRCERCRLAYLDAAQKPEAVEKAAERIGVPEKYRGKTMASWEGPFPPELRAFSERPEGMRVLYGSTKTGKTHMATAALISYVTEQKAGGRWVDASEAATILRGRGELEIAAFDLRKRLTQVGVLVVDDFGVESDMSQFEGILRSRDAHELPTLITTNLTPAHFALNPSLWGRLTTLPPFYCG